MKNFKIYIILAGVIALAAIIGLIYLVVNKNSGPMPDRSSDVVVNDNTNTPPPTTTTNTYSNSVEKYSFEYPKTLTMATVDSMYLPDGKTHVAVDSTLIHVIQTPYCAPSGKCRPNTQDFTLNSGVISQSLVSVKTKLGPDAKTETIGKHQVVTISQGVEGEGINYYFIALPNNHTLMFDQRYIDESILIKYKTVSDFIPYQKQNSMARDIISSLIFLK